MSSHGWRGARPGGVAGRRGRLAVVALAGVFALVAAGERAAAQGSAREARAPGPAPAKVHREGEYGGVRPGASDGDDEQARRERARRCRGRSGTGLTWIGFVPRDGGSRVFVQLCGEVSYTQEVAGSSLVVTLEGARHATGNARRPLDTRFFEGVVARIASRPTPRARGRRAGVQLSISFKDVADAQQAAASMRAEQDGYTYLYLDFGAGR